MSHLVRYEKPMRERAKAERKFLVTVAIDGRPAGDDSCTVQCLADLPTAKRIAAIAVQLLNKTGKHAEPSAERKHDGA
jgi:hypothetical protein